MKITKKLTKKDRASLIEKFLSCGCNSEISIKGEGLKEISEMISDIIETQNRYQKKRPNFNEPKEITQEYFAKNWEKFREKELNKIIRKSKKEIESIWNAINV